MGISIRNDCQKCRRTGLFSSDDEWEESIQMGCYRCQPKSYPQFEPFFVPSINKWRIYVTDLVLKKKWGFFGKLVSGPETTILAREIFNIDGSGHDALIPIEFDQLKETKEYIKQKHANINCNHRSNRNHHWDRFNRDSIRSIF